MQEREKNLLKRALSLIGSFQFARTWLLRTVLVLPLNVKKSNANYFSKKKKKRRRIIAHFYPLSHELSYKRRGNPFQNSIQQSSMWSPPSQDRIPLFGQSPPPSIKSPRFFVPPTYGTVVSISCICAQMEGGKKGQYYHHSKKEEQEREKRAPTTLFPSYYCTTVLYTTTTTPLLGFQPLLSFSSPFSKRVSLTPR